MLWPDNFGHMSKTEGDLTYLRLGTNGNELKPNPERARTMVI